MFVRELFKYDEGLLNVNWNMTSMDIITFLDNYGSKYYQERHKITFDIHEEGFHTLCKISLRGKSIKILDFEMHPTMVNIKELYEIIHNRISILMGTSILERNIKNIGIPVDYKNQPDIVWKNKYITMRLFLFERFSMYWCLNIKRTIYTE